MFITADQTLLYFDNFKVFYILLFYYFLTRLTLNNQFMN